MFSHKGKCMNGLLKSCYISIKCLALVFFASYSSFAIAESCVNLTQEREAELCGNVGSFDCDLNTLSLPEKREMSSVLFSIDRSEVCHKVNYCYNSWGCFPNYPHYAPLGHGGIDLQTKSVAGSRTADEVFYSLTEGIVIKAGGDYYNTIAVYDAKKQVTAIYLHARDIFVSLNESINIEEVLGIQGDIGSLGAEHVHFEIREGKKTDASNNKGGTLDPIANVWSYLSDYSIPNSVMVDGFIELYQKTFVQGISFLSFHHYSGGKTNSTLLLSYINALNFGNGKYTYKRYQNEHTLNNEITAIYKLVSKEGNDKLTINDIASIAQQQNFDNFKHLNGYKKVDILYDQMRFEISKGNLIILGLKKDSSLNLLSSSETLPYILVYSANNNTVRYVNTVDGSIRRVDTSFFKTQIELGEVLSLRYNDDIYRKILPAILHIIDN